MLVSILSVPADNPNIVPHLDESRSYIYCPRCEDMGYANVEMRKDGHRFVCPLQHELDIHTVQKLVKAGRTLHMVPLTLIEQPSPNMVKATFWIHPETLATIKLKFQGREIVTMDTFFNLIASDGVMFIVGEDVKKLKGYGITKPQDIVAALEGAHEQDVLHKALVARLQPILDAAMISSSEAPTV